MRFRIVRDGEGFITEVKYKFWPCWTAVFDIGWNYFRSAEEAESAIKRVIDYQQTDGIVVKEIPAP